MMPEQRNRGARRPVDVRADVDAHALDPEAIRSADLLRRILGSLPVVVYRCRTDPDRAVEFMSLGCRTLLGFEAGDLTGSRVAGYAHLVHADDRSRVQGVLREAVRTGEPFQVTYRVTRVDGREVTVREHGYPVIESAGAPEAIEGFIVGIQGVTEHELEQRALDIAHDLNNVLATIKTTAELATLTATDRTLVEDLTEIMAAAVRGSGLAERLRRLGTAPSADGGE